MIVKENLKSAQRMVEKSRAKGEAEAYKLAGELGGYGFTGVLTAVLIVKLAPDSRVVVLERRIEIPFGRIF